jgi:DNA repair protein RecN (Recombination protein N)
MLLSIRISNLAIIESVQLELADGFNVITGETGSGKSLVLKALSLLLGDKASADWIGPYGTQARVEGLFSLVKRPDIRSRLADLGLTHDSDPHEMLIRRVLSADKSKIFINDHTVTLQTLKSIVSPLMELTQSSAPLVELTGQFENKNLLEPTYHLELLDQYLGLENHLSEYYKLYREWVQVQEQENALQRKQGDRNQKLDYLKFQQQEIESFGLDLEQDARLEQDIQLLKEQLKLIEFQQLAQSTLSEGPYNVTDQLNTLQKKLLQLPLQGDLTTSWIEQLEKIRESLSELSYQIESKIKSSEDLESELQEKMERLSHLRRLQKKFGPTLEDIAQNYQGLVKEIEELEKAEWHLDRLREQKAQLEAQLRKQALDMHSLRLKGATEIQTKIQKELDDLNMKGLEVSWSLRQEAELSPTGLTHAELLCKNKGSAKALPLGKAASGGELSRILLATKVILSDEKWPRTYLFDEVDTGVSGVTAEKIGKKLKQVAGANGQVIGITHLPQVAVWADHHVLINKELSGSGDEVQVHVKTLDSEERTQEIARLLSGETITASSLRNAKELLRQASQIPSRPTKNSQ